MKGWNKRTKWKERAQPALEADGFKFYEGLVIPKLEFEPALSVCAPYVEDFDNWNTVRCPQHFIDENTKLQTSICENCLADSSNREKASCFLQTKRGK